MTTPWFPFYPTDYLADTIEFSALEHGAYLLLILHYWRERGLPDSEDRIRRIAKLTEKEWAKARPMLIEKFYDGWRHNRIDSELEKADVAYARRAKAGRDGGLAKASNAKAGLGSGSSNPSGCGSGSSSGSLSTCQGIEVRRAILGAHKLRSVGDAA